MNDLPGPVFQNFQAENFSFQFLNGLGSGGLIGNGLFKDFVILSPQRIGGVPVIIAQVPCGVGQIARQRAEHLTTLLLLLLFNPACQLLTAAAQGLMDADMHSLLVLGITLSMAMTPLMVLALARSIKPKPAVLREPPPEYRQLPDDAPRVVIAGMGRMGQVVARIMRAQGVPFVALDTSVDTIELTRSYGNIPIFYGDPLRPEILRAAQVEKAEFFVVATDDPQTNIETARLVRKLYPHIKVIGRARNRQHVYHLLDADATPVRETFHSSLEMSRLQLTGLGLNEEQVGARIRRFKRHDEAVLMAQYRVYDDEKAVVQTAREARKELETLFEADHLEDQGIGHH